ncbi:AraC-like DNA-binding protein [Chryseobacterium ginsenosidimutans]|uniref:helix-turn-helix domain-containing protein n=1 Tax=Chryseobacterium ginsenosidimutans TaxID=687846 RepID=UPI002168BF3E|nr:helix-turn-helix domain-containing protein [Chryseobacterium ginsenosidimutans]MCS3869482.1 AraC-like DNA-binding protein [Chryseobacterium ginsenosidimutans]
MELPVLICKSFPNIFLKIIKKSNCFLLLLSICPIFFLAQTNKDFEILKDKAFQKLYENPEDCIHYTQSLLLSEKEKDNRIILQKIISQAYILEGNYVQAISIYNQRGNEYESEGLAYFVQLFDSYNLADIYQDLKLYSQSQKIISQVLEDRNLLKTTDDKVRSVVAKLYQLQAINAAISKNYELAIKSLKQSDQYLDINTKEARFLKQENVVFLSSFLMRLNKLDEAKQFLEKIIPQIEVHDKSPFLLAYAYQNLSKCYFQKKEYTIAIEKLKIGFQKIEELPYNGMKLIFYDLFSKNYLALKNYEKYVYYNHLYDSTKKILETNRKEGIQYSIKLLESQQKENYIFKDQLHKSTFKSLIQICVFLILGSLIFWFYQFKISNNLKKQILFFQKLAKQGTVFIKQKATNEDKNLKEQIYEKEITNSSKERDLKILKNIEEWEKTDSFLNKNMSLTVFSQQIGINKQYLSEFINTNKEKNFNTYINELRISHIANLLKNDPSYLNYKVSYLAEYAGFSSHGAFSNVFKSITGMSPNTYIQQIIKSKSQ